MKQKTITIYSFNELSEEAKVRAIMDHIAYMQECEHEDHYKNWPEYRAAIDEADRLQTPWFTSSILYEKIGKDQNLIAHLNENYEFTKDGKITDQ